MPFAYHKLTSRCVIRKNNKDVQKALPVFRVLLFDVISDNHDSCFFKLYYALYP